MPAAEEAAFAVIFPIAYAQCGKQRAFWPSGGGIMEAFLRYPGVSHVSKSVS